MQRVSRMNRELSLLEREPPPGISCWQKDNDVTHLEAQIFGGEGTPYSGGVFKLEITIPDRYPFEPPKVQYVTPIYHPNIDTIGRICLDLLKMPPAGNWKPSLNICTVLTSIQLLMAEPNPDDPLMADISTEFKHNRALYIQRAQEWTKLHATAGSVQPASSGQTESSDGSSDSDSDSSSSESEDDEQKPTTNHNPGISTNQNGLGSSCSANQKLSSKNQSSAEAEVTIAMRGEKRCWREVNGDLKTAKKSHVTT